jgi:predicted nucleic-acid-binding Zn-ribbon protein
VTCPSCGGAELQPVGRNTPAGPVAEEYVLPRIQTTEHGERAWDNSEGLPVRARVCLRCGYVAFWAARLEEGGGAG